MEKLSLYFAVLIFAQSSASIDSWQNYKKNKNNYTKRTQTSQYTHILQNNILHNSAHIQNIAHKTHTAHTKPHSLDLKKYEVQFKKGVRTKRQEKYVVSWSSKFRAKFNVFF